MKRKRLTLAAVAALAAAVAVPIAASGGDGKGRRVVIAERMTLTGPTTQAGTFSAAGAVNDAGAASATFTVTPAQTGRGILRGTHTLTGALGTITVRVRARVRPFPPPTPPRALAEGHWWIVDGTGAYEDLSGGGGLTAVADFTNSQITIIRSGRVREDD